MSPTNTALNAGSGSWQRDRYEVWTKSLNDDAAEWRCSATVKDRPAAVARIDGLKKNSAALAGFIDTGRFLYRVVHCTGTCEVVE